MEKELLMFGAAAGGIIVKLCCVHMPSTEFDGILMDAKTSSLRAERSAS